MDYLDKYLKYLKNKGLNPLTIRNYSFYLKRFFEFGRIKTPKEITLGKIQSFEKYLEQLQVHYKFLNKSTRSYHLIAIRSFLKFLQFNKIKNCPAAQQVKLEKLDRRSITLTKIDLERLLEAPRKFNNPEIIKSRDKAILEIFFATGLKVSELANLKIKNMDLIKGKAIVSRGAFDLSNQAKFWLKDYIQMRSDNLTSLFISHDRASKLRNKPLCLSPRSIQRLVGKYAKASGLTKKITPQTLRRAFANNLLKQGADIKEVQKKLGHQSVNTINLIYNN